jgi:hypothetical protein
MFGVYMFLFYFCAVLCLGRGLATSWSLVQGVLPIVNRSGNWKAALAHKGSRASQEEVFRIPFSVKIIAPNLYYKYSSFKVNFFRVWRAEMFNFPEIYFSEQNIIIIYYYY